MRNANPVVLFFSAFFLAAGCDREAGQLDTQTTLLEDMVATVPRARITEELRLDANVEDFSAFTRFLVGPREEIVVPLRQDMHVRVYDASGRRTATIGQRGSGPGEFQSLSTIGWRADTLWIHDTRQGRVTFFDPTGTMLRTTPIPAGRPLDDPSIPGTLGHIATFGPFSVFSDGSMLGETRHSVTRNGRRGVSPRSFALLPETGNAVVVAHPPSFEDPRWVLEIAGLGQLVPFVMWPQTAWSFDGLRLASLHSEVTTDEGGTVILALYRWPETGPTVQRSTRVAQGGATDSLGVAPAFERTYAFRGEPIPKGAIDSALAAFIPPPGAPREGPEDLPQRFQALARERMPAIYTPVSAMRLGLDDTIWFDLRPSAEGRPSLILDGSGNPIGTVLVPLNVTIRQSSLTHIWATERDEFDLNSIVRYRIEGLR